MRGSRARTSAAAVAVVSLVVSLAPPAAWASDGDLDPTFDDDGIATIVFRGGSYANDVAVQPVGDIVAVGAAAGPSSRGAFAVARTLADGTADLSFSSDGRVTTHVPPGGGDEAHAVAIQANGRILVAGTDSRNRFAVVRYLPDGSLDASFGGDGIVTTNLTPVDDLAYDVLVQPDGKIVAVGSGGGWHPRFALVRYRRNGALDRTFGDGGKVLTRVGVWGVASAATLQPDGAILAVGTTGGAFELVRYLPTGELDATFGDGGKVRDTVAGGWAGAVVLQPNGRIVVGGDLDIFRSAIARYTAGGRLDAGFGDDGVVVTDVGSSEEAVVQVVLQPSGRIMAVGRVGPHEYVESVLWRFYVMALGRDGTPDATFGDAGTVITGFPPRGAFADGAAVQSDGRIVVAGGLGEANAEAFVLVRYLV